jgi:hypothetical protein
MLGVVRVVPQRHHAHLDFWLAQVFPVALAVDIDVKHWLTRVVVQESVQTLVEGALRKVLYVRVIGVVAPRLVRDGLFSLPNLEAGVYGWLGGLLGLEILDCFRQLQHDCWSVVLAKMLAMNTAIQVISLHVATVGCCQQDRPPAQVRQVSHLLAWLDCLVCEQLWNLLLVAYEVKILNFGSVFVQKLSALAHWVLESEADDLTAINALEQRSDWHRDVKGLASGFPHAERFRIEFESQSHVCFLNVVLAKHYRVWQEVPWVRCELEIVLAQAMHN